MLHTRCDAALRDARADFERTLAVLREENSTLRRMLEAQARRADELTTELARSIVVQPTPTIVPPPFVPPPTSKDPIHGLGNILDPVDFKHPDATFSSARAASLMAVEDEDDGAARSAA